MTLLRSLIIAALAVAAARPLRRVLAERRRSVRRAVWILLLAPYFTPDILIGYGYASFSLSLIHHPVLNEIFYSALLWWKFTPVAAVILYFTPAPISAEAVHCHKLISTVGTAQRAVPTIKSRLREWMFLLRAGCAGGPAAAFAIVFLFAFAEFETASLMMVKTWTVALFYAHTGGLALSESLRRMVGPFFCEAAAIILAFIVLGRRKVVPARNLEARPAGRRFAWCHLIIALAFIVVIPAAMVLAGTVHGLSLILQNFVLSREILASLFFATGASIVAGILAFWLGSVSRDQKPKQVGTARRAVTAPFRRGTTPAATDLAPTVPPAGRGRGQRGALSLPILCKLFLVAALFAGLLGPLVLSLTVLAAFQLPGLISLRDTPVPLVLTLGLLLLPMALVLTRVLELTRHRSALHLAALMEKSRASHELVWRLRTSGKFWTMVLLFVWAYWDLTASAILAPIGMTPVTVRLFNLMHYGQIATLSAMTCAAFAAPILISLLALGTRRWWAHA